MNEAGQMAARTRVRAADVVWLSAAAATMAALAHNIALYIRGSVLHQFTWMGSDLPWMTLVGNVVIFALLGTAVFGAGLVSGFLRRPSMVVGILAFFAALSVFLLVTEVWQYASLALALGVSAQLARAATRDPERFFRTARATALSTGIVGLVVAGQAWYQAPPPAPATASSTTEERPNVLLIILDTVRAASTSLYGYERPTTPGLQVLAAEATVFDRAVATAPWTLPSHCSLFTGREAQQTTCRWRAPLDAGPTTLAEVLREHGYRTGGFVANYYYTTRETGLTRGFDHWDDFQRSWKEVLCSTVLAQTGIARSALWGNTARERLFGLLHLRLRGDPKPEHDRKPAAVVNRELLAWLDEAPGQPFFAFLNYFDAHDPYAAPTPFSGRFPRGKMDQGEYDGGIAYIDQELAALVDTLRERRLLDKTVLVIASDHGELFGEHQLFGHGNALYWPLLHVPLIIRYPGRAPAGRRVAQTVSLRDVPQTILGLTSVRDPRIHGTTLAATWGDSAATDVSPAVSFVEKGRIWWGKEPAKTDSLASLTVGAWQYIRTFAGTEELFDLSADPTGERDLARQASEAGQRGQLHDGLLRLLQRAGAVK